MNSLTERPAIFRAGLISIFVLLALASVRYQPPAPRPATAPASEFSGVRARAAYQRALGEPTPHWVGNPHDAEIRERIVAQLRELGYAPESIEGFSCGSNRGCGKTVSIIARREGRDKGPAVLFNCHYDSVRAGPGVSDDGAGVSAGLEIARALAQEPPHRRAIDLVFNEGEESGLLGAEALVKRKDLLSGVAAVVNLEARGTDGPSLMFETTPGNAELIELYAKTIERPATNSLYYAVYKTLPNDTDLTVFKREGLAGFGFAFIGGTARYHTPLDDLTHSDVGSVQHQGENALALVRALADAELHPQRRDDVFFFDVFGFFVLRGSLGLLRILALLAAIAFILAVRALAVPLRTLAAGAGVFLACVLVPAGISIGLNMLLRAPFPWLAHPTAIRALFVAVPLAVCAAIRTLAPGPAGLWTGAWAVLTLLGAGLAIPAPEVAYALVLPSLIAGIAGIAAARRPALAAAAVLAPALAAMVLLLPIAWLLYDALGTILLPASATLFAILFALVLPAAPTSGSVRIAALAGIASIALGIAAVRTPPFSPDNPRHENVVYFLDTDGPKAQWVVEGTAQLDPSMRAAAKFGDKPETPIFWLPNYKAFATPAPAVAIEPPRLENVQFEGGRIRAVLRSPRGASRAGLQAPSDRVKAIRLAGQAPRELTSKNRLALGPYSAPGTIHQRWETLTPEGVPVELDVEGDAPIDVLVWDQTQDLPAGGSALVAARSPDSCQVQDGDRTMVFHKVRLARQDRP